MGTEQILCIEVQHVYGSTKAAQARAKPFSKGGNVNSALLKPCVLTSQHPMED